MADDPDFPYEYRILRIPRGTDIDGAIAELHVSEGGSLVTMDVRIPARSAIDAYQEASNEISDAMG